MKHHSKSKVGRRRSHLALKPVSLNACQNCGYPIKPHRFCANCGNYKGKIIKTRKLKAKKS